MMSRTVDYAGIRGFNYTQPDARDDRDFWLHYSHEIVNQEDYAERAIFYAERAIRETRRPAGGDPAADAEKLLEACEFAANLLETGELVPMNAPPTARIEAYRRMETPDCGMIRDYLTELIGILRREAHVISPSDGFRELRK